MQLTGSGSYVKEGYCSSISILERCLMTVFGVTKEFLDRLREQLLLTVKGRDLEDFSLGASLADILMGKFLTWLAISL